LVWKNSANFLAFGVNFLAFLWKSFVIERAINIHGSAAVHMVNLLAIFET